MKKEMTRKITVINGENKGEYMKNKKIYHIILEGVKFSVSMGKILL